MKGFKEYIKDAKNKNKVKRFANSADSLKDEFSRVMPLFSASEKKLLKKWKKKLFSNIDDGKYKYSTDLVNHMKDIAKNNIQPEKNNKI